MLHEIISKIDQVKVNKQGEKYAVYKPLLLLIVLDEISQGKPNQFPFHSIYKKLTALMEKYGWKTVSKKRAEYPFHFLASSELWQTNIDKSKLKHKDAPTKAELDNAVGKLDDKIYSHFRDNPADIGQVVAFIEKKFFGRSLTM